MRCMLRMIQNCQNGSGLQYAIICNIIVAYLKNCHLRFNPVPEAGESKGLDLVLDAHTDLITASSVTKPFQVCNHNQIHMPPLILIPS